MVRAIKLWSEKLNYPSLKLGIESQLPPPSGWICKVGLKPLFALLHIIPMLKRGVSEKSMGLLNMVIILLKHGVITPAFRMGLKLNNPSLQAGDGTLNS